MNITINDTQIMMQADNTSLPYTLLMKPDIADYGNASARPLVKSYHLVKESIWERFGQCAQDLAKHYPDDSRSICYLMAFGALYAPLLANSQTKNILFYGSPEASPFLTVLHDFITFLQADNSLIALPRNPFVFSGLTNGSWHMAIIDLDICCDPQAICGIITKVRKGGTVLLYTVSGTSTDNIAGLLNYARKVSFSSCTLYVLTIDPAISDLVYPYTAEALVLTRTEELLTQVGELRQLTQSMELGNCSPEDCLYATELLRQAEDTLFASYDYLEDSELPLYANTLKEAVMDYYISICDMGYTEAYSVKLRHAAQAYFTAIEAEFQC